MERTRGAARGYLPVGLLVAALALFLAGAWLALHNPTIHDTSRGDFQCLAAYDIVLNHEDNSDRGDVPGGIEQIKARCDSSGHTRFSLAVLAGAAALVLVAGAAALSRSRRSRGPDTRSSQPASHSE